MFLQKCCKRLITLEEKSRSVCGMRLFSTKNEVKLIQKINLDPVKLDFFQNHNAQEKDESIPSVQHINCLNDKFRLKNFKPLQWTVINSILKEQQDNFVIMPTGYGKSLCFQFPAVFTNSLSVVISPLISLMQDQVNTLEKLNIPACYLGPAQDDKSVLKKLYNNHYRILYMTPETALSPFGVEVLAKLNDKTKIVLLTVDEAHCVLQWGTDFRPCYKKLGMLRDILPSVPLLALTGTTTKEEKYGIYHFLGLRNPNEMSCGFNRPNLYYLTRQMSKKEYADILQVLTDDKKALNIEDGSVIIYCLTRKKCEKVAASLKKMRTDCEVYHSGLSNKLRKQILTDFMNDKIKIMVATTSFGMGVNKSNVRMVIHYGTPLSMEGYYQEVGRAGRDNKPALCVLYYSQTDFFIHRYLNESKNVSGRQEAEQRNNIMKRYISLTTCRRKFILNYFGSSFAPSVAENCCDNCRSNQDNIHYIGDFTKDVELVLDLLNNNGFYSFGKNFYISLLVGASYKNYCYRSNKFFGRGAHRSREWWSELMFILEMEKYLKNTNKLVGAALYSKLELNHRGKKWIFDRSNGLLTPIELKLSKKLKLLLDDSGHAIQITKITENKIL